MGACAGVCRKRRDRWAALQPGISGLGGKDGTPASAERAEAAAGAPRGWVKRGQKVDLMTLGSGAAYGAAPRALVLRRDPGAHPASASVRQACDLDILSVHSSHFGPR